MVKESGKKNPGSPLLVDWWEGRISLINSAISVVSCDVYDFSFVDCIHRVIAFRVETASAILNILANTNHDLSG